MTHNRKPDVLPVEGASIAEALHALACLEGTDYQSPYVTAAYCRAIRSALERAAAEEEAWRVIEEWLDADDERYQTSGRTYEVGYYHSLLRRDERLHAAFGSTRLEALQAAAEWVKAQALPAPPKGSTP